MLVLSRRIGESIVVGDNVVVTVSRIQGNQVRLCISAPREVSIRRSELPEHTDVDSAAIYQMLQVSDSGRSLKRDNIRETKRYDRVDVVPSATQVPTESSPENKSPELVSERSVVPFFSRKTQPIRRPPRG